MLKKNSFEKRVRFLAGLFVAVTAVFPLLIFFITSNLKACLLCFTGCLALCVIAVLLYRTEDAYITGIVIKLSSLVDVLLELEEREVFSDNEDTALSKLQSKVIKLARILKHKNIEAEQGQENIKSLVSDIAHQLKTPISNLTMYSEFLREDGLADEKRREYTEIICLTVRRLNFLTENMIKISRLESGLIQLNMQRQNLNETVLKAVKDIYPKARQKNTEIIYREDGQVMVNHDRNWTAEAVCNLLDNAVKYADRDSKIILSIKDSALFAEISVEDENGPIPEEERAKVFARFYRGKDRQAEEGIGVGLYLSREITVKQGGYIRLKPTARGNIFSIVMRK
ncbi:sensor histidine kinase [bacterium D16-51]|nr:sensor histidine kinase [bacterium D16-59]RKI61786.1 sensor histidine kinase [bacterium D16-51]